MPRADTELLDVVLQCVRDALRGVFVPIKSAQVNLARVVFVTDDVNLELGLPLLDVELE